MTKPTIVFLCQHIFEDENRAQYNRTRFLCDHFPTHIVASGFISPKASRNALSVQRYMEKKRFKLFFPFWALARLWKLKREHRQTSPLIVYCTYEPQNLITAYLAKKWLNYRWVPDLWDTPEKSYLILKHLGKGFKNRIKRGIRRLELMIVKRVLKRSDQVILAILPEEFSRKYQLPAGNILSITNGINLEMDFDPGVEQKEDMFTVFYCGTVDLLRLEGVFEALSEVVRHVSPIRFVVIGREADGGYAWLEREFQPLEGKVLLENMGKQPYLTVIEKIKESHVCICPYPAKLDIAQTYIVKLFDYMAAGRPLVASALPGTLRIIKHRFDGLLFQPGDYLEMARQIIELYESVPLRESLAQNALQSVRRFNWDNIHQDLYRFLVQGEREQKTALND
jgi:glycosyltransferase involved in cell wall biosynthesis